MLRRAKGGGVIVIAVVLAACGSSSKTSTAADDLALAKGAVLTDTDAPLSYSAQPHKEGAGPSEQAKRDFASCLQSGADYGAAAVETFPADGVGERAVGFGATVPVTAQGESATVHSDLILGQRGRGAISLVATGTSPPDETLAIARAKQMSERLGEKAP